MNAAREDGVTVFNSLVEALQAGFQLFVRTPDGYIVRARLSSGWALAKVKVRPSELR